MTGKRGKRLFRLRGRTPKREKVGERRTRLRNLGTGDKSDYGEGGEKGPGGGGGGFLNNCRMIGEETKLGRKRVGVGCRDLQRCKCRNEMGGGVHRKGATMKDNRKWYWKPERVHKKREGHRSLPAGDGKGRGVRGGKAKHTEFEKTERGCRETEGLP